MKLSDLLATVNVIMRHDVNKKEVKVYQLHPINAQQASNVNKRGVEFQELFQGDLAVK